MNDLIARFTTKYGGEIVGTAYRNDEQAAIGYLKTNNAYLVFYPDGTKDRFELNDERVAYRDGFMGPDINIVAMVSKPIARTAVTPNASKSPKVPTKASKTKTATTRKPSALIVQERSYGNIVIPEFLQEFMGRAKLAFSQAQEAGGNKQYSYALDAFQAILDSGYFLNVATDFTRKDVMNLRDLPDMYHAYLGAKYVG